MIGYLPNPMTAYEPNSVHGRTAAKAVPQLATQHATAGPYSPVIEVDARRLVVISGQAAIDDDGSVVGETIEEQTRLTLERCQRALAHAGASLKDVFKVNAYLRSLDDWAAFNEVYREVMPTPLPVRTAVGVDLLMCLLVEVEMWAARP